MSEVNFDDQLSINRDFYNTMMLIKYIFVIVVFSIIDIKAENVSCENNSECTGNTICIQGTCLCDQVSFSKEGGKCLNYVTEYKGYCEDSDQCAWLGLNAECNNRVCTCKENFRWYQGSCQRYVGMEKTCKNNIDCFDGMDPLALKCESEKCICNDGYYSRGPDCRKSSTNKKCAINFDCNPTGNSNLICLLGTCTDADSIVNSGFAEENEYYDEELPSIGKTFFDDDSNTISCTRDSECVNMANSVCDKNTKTCKCKSDTYFLHDGNCLPGFNFCDNEKDCKSNANSQCFKNVCICKPGYFYYKGVCTPEIGMKDSTLKVVSNCKIRPGKIQDNTCYCQDYWFVDDSNRNCIKTTLQQTYSCLTGDWCNAMGPNSFCNASSLCQCSTGTTFNELKFYCEGSSTSECLRDSQCTFNKRCQNEKCICAENFSDIKGDCLPDLGGSCAVERCPVESSICLDNTCTCTTNCVEYSNACLKVAENWNDNCEVREQCQKLKFAECGKKNKCSCIYGYEKQKDDKCWESKDYGDSCMNSKQCTVVLNKYYQCRNSKCLCPIGETLENGYCIINSSIYFLPSSLLLLLLSFGVFIV